MNTPSLRQIGIGLGWVNSDPAIPADSLTQCLHCHRYIERAPEDDEYVSIEYGIPEAWAHARYFIACNPGSCEPRVYHQPEPISATWERELPRMIALTYNVVEELT